MTISSALFIHRPSHNLLATPGVVEIRQWTAGWCLVDPSCQVPEEHVTSLGRCNGRSEQLPVTYTVSHLSFKNKVHAHPWYNYVWYQAEPHT